MHSLTLHSPRPSAQDERRLFVAVAKAKMGEGELLAEGAVVGSCSVSRTSSQGANINNMAVHPEVRGHGVGALLMRYAKDLAKSLGYLHLRLVTGNSRAAHFYEREGFRTYWSLARESEMDGIKLCVGRGG